MYVRPNPSMSQTIYVDCATGIIIIASSGCGWECLLWISAAKVDQRSD